MNAGISRWRTASHTEKQTQRNNKHTCISGRTNLWLAESSLVFSRMCSHIFLGLGSPGAEINQNSSILLCCLSSHYRATTHTSCADAITVRLCPTDYIACMHEMNNGGQQASTVCVNKANE